MPAFWLDSLRYIRDPGLVRLLAETIESQASFACDAGGLLYIYRDGVYVPEAERYVKQDVQTRTLQPHTPAYLSTVQLPVQFNPTADCPAWDDFLSKVIPADIFDAQVIWTIIAYLVLPVTDAHQAILVSGSGGNGKSSFLNGLRSLLGPSAVASQNLDAITSDRFAAAHLYGKLANICDDLSSRHLADTSTFKRIVGGDIITADRKYRDPLVFRPFARLVFSANEFPQVFVTSDGFFDRWVAIPFNTSFRGQSGELPRHILDAYLAAPQELSGVLNRALAALPSILGLGCRLPRTSSMRVAWGEFRSASDWLILWLERTLIWSETGVIEKRALYNQR